MPTVAELQATLDELAPPELAYPDDPIGLQAGRKSDIFDSALVTLDVTPAAVERACAIGAQAIVTHHAPIYHPLRHLAGDGLQAQVLRGALANGIAILVAHTNWDAAPNGINDTLASRLGLHDVVPFGDDIQVRSMKVSVFVPSAHCDRLIDALSGAGAGGLGLYRRCAFYAPGTGTFEPQEGASPAIGSVGSREEVQEMRVEMRLPISARAAVENALLDAHPYEEPAYDFWEVAAKPASLGRWGRLPSAIPFSELRALVDTALGSRCELYGKPERKVSKVAVIGGAGGDVWIDARMAGCDVLVTGECRHHEAVEAAETGFGIVEAGHYPTEQPGMERLAELLGGRLDAKFEVFVPNVGRCGRSDA